MTIPVFYHPCYSSLTLPEKHRFPIDKYALLYTYLRDNLAQHLNFITPLPADIEDIKTVHNAQYVDGFISGDLSAQSQRRIGFPKSDALVNRTLYSIGASIQGAKLALKTGIACQISGGYHHSFPEFGSGFCVFNDLVIAANHLLRHTLCQKVVILDLDVHQGDGTAVCCEPFDNIVSISMHCEQNFPAKKQYSNYDFPLQKNADSQCYMSVLEQCLMTLRIEQPDIVLYNAGADIYSGDELGYLDISLAGVKQRDRRVISFCKDFEIPLFTVSGGGYQRDINKLIEVHKQLYLSLIMQ
jgi:acetoin utilization deacetylase AcuC-like enzyme